MESPIDRELGAELTVKGDDTEPPDDQEPDGPTPAEPAPPVEGEPGFTG